MISAVIENISAVIGKFAEILGKIDNPEIKCEGFTVIIISAVIELVNLHFYISAVQ